MLPTLNLVTPVHYNPLAESYTFKARTRPVFAARWGEIKRITISKELLDSMIQIMSFEADMVDSINEPKTEEVSTPADTSSWFADKRGFQQGHS